LAQDGSLPMYAPLYRKRGAICSQVSLVSNAASSVNGEAVWFRPALADRPHYPAGWPDGITLTLSGSRYSPPAAELGAAAPNAVRVTLSGGNLSADLTAPALLSGTSLSLTQPSNIAGFAFSVNPANGVFAGRFIHPATGLPGIFKGVMLQNRTGAAGFFLGATESGAIEVMPGTTN
jgi:hypothetical protein